MDFSIQAACGATLLVATVTDILYSRVPNWLTLPACITAFGMHTLSRGADGALFASLGLLTGFALLIGFYAAGGMGAGDVKLLSAIGAFVGSESVVQVFLYTGLFGGIYAIAVVLWVHRKVDRARRSSVLELLKSLLLSQGATRVVEDAFRGYPKLRYAVSIAAGFLAAEARPLL